MAPRQFWAELLDQSSLIHYELLIINRQLKSFPQAAKKGTCIRIKRRLADDDQALGFLRLRPVGILKQLRQGVADACARTQKSLSRKTSIDHRSGPPRLCESQRPFLAPL